MEKKHSACLCNRPLFMKIDVMCTALSCLNEIINYFSIFFKDRSLFTVLKDIKMETNNGIFSYF